MDSPTGVGWSSSVVTRLYLAVYLFSAPSTYQKRAVIVMPSGERWAFTDNGNNTFTAPVGRHDTLVRNGDGTYDLTLQGSRTKFHFASDGSLVSSADEYLNTLNYTYDTNGRISQIADGAGSGRYLTIIFGADGRISTIRDHTNRQVQYVYNGQGALTTATVTSAADPATRVTTYGYTAGRFGPVLNQIKDQWNRVITDVTYDTSYRVHTYTEGGETYTYTYNYTGNPQLVQKTDTIGKYWVYTFLPSGLITDRTPPYGGGGNVHTDYYADQSVQQVIDGVGVKTYNVWDSQGNLTQVTKDYQGPLAVRYDYAYDPAFPGKVTSITPKDPTTGNVNLDWQASRYDYYQTGSPAPGALFHAYRVRDDGTTLDTLSTYVYNSHGQLTQTTSATGGVTDYTYDASGNLWKVTAPANNDLGTRPVTTYLYDTLGRVTSVTDALGHQTTYTYDTLDRRLTKALPKPSTGSTLTFVTTYSYDSFDASSGSVFSILTDPNGIVTRRGFDQYGQLTSVVDALLNTTIYAYSRGLLASITDVNGNVTSYAYDAGRRLISTTFPNAFVETYTYWDDNKLHEKDDSAGSNRYTYDHLKRVSLAETAYPPSRTYTYDGQKLIQVDDTHVSPTDTHLMGYDSSYRLASVTQGTRGTITYGYNADDTTQTYSVQSGPGATYTYYPDGSLNTIAWSPVSNTFKYRYTLTGQYQSVTMPSAATRNYSYDDQGRLLTLTNLTSASGNLATYAYGYDYDYTNASNDRKGQRISMTATVPAQNLSGHLFKYEYDQLYQLNKATYPNIAPFLGEVDSWTYDAIGNRLTNTVSGSTQNYAYQTLQGHVSQFLTSDGVNTYQYDGLGNLYSRTGYTFGWDSDHRLSTIGTGINASYVYDYQGRREKKTVTSVATSYLYDRLNLVQEVGSTTADYLFGPGIDEPLAMSRGGQVYYYVVDGLGSVTEVTNASAAVQNAYLYDAWGQTKSQSGSLANPFNYTSRETGEAATLFYRARYYQPTVGRFLSEDPWNRGWKRGSRARPGSAYSYSRSSPAIGTDPLGLFVVYRVDKSCEPFADWVEEEAEAGRETAGSCLPDRLTKPLNARGSTPVRITCGGANKDDCARGGSTTGVILYDGALNDPGCGCLRSTILHELVHVAGEPDNDVAWGCEKWCFPGCSVTPEGTFPCQCR